MKTRILLLMIFMFACDDRSTTSVQRDAFTSPSIGGQMSTAGEPASTPPTNTTGGTASIQADQPDMTVMAPPASSGGTMAPTGGDSEAPQEPTAGQPVAMGGAGGVPSSPPNLRLQRSCERKLTYWASSEVESVFVAGEFTCTADGRCWGDGAQAMVKNPAAIHPTGQDCASGGPCLFELSLNPGPRLVSGSMYAYKLVIGNPTAGGQWIMDPEATHHKYGTDCLNSALVMPACTSGPEITVDAMEHAAGMTNFSLKFTVKTATDGQDIDAVDVSLDGMPIMANGPDENGTYDLSGQNLGFGKHRISIRARDDAGRDAEPVDLPFWIEEERFDYRDGVLYLLFIDRFANGNPANDRPLDDDRVFPIANWFGGDLEGATIALESGYFDELGVSTIWLSPVNLQVDRAMKARSSDHQIAPYHGYWPTKARDVEPRFGGADALKTFVQRAHERGIRVLLDLINNQVHEEHEYVDSNPAWFRTDCVCGTPGCGWSEKPLSCLFATYLPDINWTNPDARDRFIDDAVYWIEEFDVDGFRVDAVKHVETTAIYNMRSRLGQRFEQGGHRIVMLGETAVGSVERFNQLCVQYNSGYEWISAYTGDNALDGQFDFPTHHRMGGILTGGSLRDIEDALVAMADNYRSNDLHVRFIGSHDTARVASIAANDPARGCRFPDECDVDLPTASVDEQTYARLRLGFGLLYAIPGIPLLYNGDEFAVPGGNDPDNRRGMPWSGDRVNLNLAAEPASQQQESFHQFMTELGQLRQSRPALRNGQRTSLYVDDDVMIFARHHGSDWMVVALNKGGRRIQNVDLSPWVDGAAPQPSILLGDGQVSGDGAQVSLDLPTMSFTIVGPR